MSQNEAGDLGVKTHLEALLEAVGPVTGLAIFDIGCGEGQLARALAAHGATVTGFDPFIPGTERIPEGEGSYRLVTAAADAIPERDGSADLVLFVFSLHHVPGAKLGPALAEAKRLLKPSGRLYVAEPLAVGPNQYVTELFHDETAVRKAASAALAQHATPNFPRERVLGYTEARRFADFETFAARMIANRRFNGYSEEAVLTPEVRQRFAHTLARHHGRFDQPVRINLYA
jgi:ubiquinone/menaquinone biosynthesis C-methylase UbiE